MLLFWLLAGPGSGSRDQSILRRCAPWLPPSREIDRRSLRGQLFGRSGGSRPSFRESMPRVFRQPFAVRQRIVLDMPSLTRSWLCLPKLIVRDPPAGAEPDPLVIRQIFSREDLVKGTRAGREKRTV